MFILKKIVTPFILPPGIFIIILLFAGLWLLFKKKKDISAGLLICLIAIVMWVFSVSPVSDRLLKGLEADFGIPENVSGDVIVLLGGGVYGKAPDFSGTGAPSEEMMVRIVTAVRLQKKLNIPVIVSGGKVFKYKDAEAPIIKRFLVDLGVPDKKVIIEDRSRDTIENAMFTKEIMERHRFKKPLLVTSALHMKRSVLSFKKAGMNVMPFPAGFRTWENKKYGWEDYLPWHFIDSYAAIHEYLGLLFYKIAY